jgi:hypothetical protein
LIDIEETRRAADRAGFTVFVFPTTGIVDRASFFAAVRATFPLDPPLRGSYSWDALSDSLWEGLFNHDSHRFAIVWQGTTAFSAAVTSDFETALGVLSDVATLLGDPIATGGRTKLVAILVE